METAFNGLIVLMVLMLLVFTFAYGYLQLQEGAMDSVRAMESRLSDQLKTDLTPTSAETMGGGGIVNVTIANEGDVKLADFDRWDVIVEYEGATGGQQIAWLPYEGSADSRWMVNGIYAAGESETFEPNVLNPGEELVMQLWLSPTVALTSTNRVTVATPNGVSASAIFTY